MSAILAILLMLGGLLVTGAVFVPHARAQPNLEVVPSIGTPLGGPVNESLAYTPLVNGSTLTVYIDVLNVNASGLLGYQVGFYFNETYLQVTSVSDAGFLTSAGGSVLASFGFADHGLSSVYNSSGEVYAVGEALSGGPFATGSGPLVKVTFEIVEHNPATLYYTGVFPGSFVSMMRFTTVLGDNSQLILTNGLGNDITPLTMLVDGFFQEYVTPHGPTASLVVSPNPAQNATDVVTFDASGSLPGSNGIVPIPIDWYYYCFGDGTSLNTTMNKVTHGPYVYATLPQYLSVNVTVHAGTTGINTCTTQTLEIVPKVTVPPTVVAYNVTLPHPPYGAGTTFTAYVYALNISAAQPLFGFQVGFTFDATYLQVLNVNYGNFLTSNGGTVLAQFNGTIDNVGGKVTAYSEILNNSANAVYGSGPLLVITFEVNPSLYPPYTGTYPGSPVSMVGLNLTETDIQTLLIDNLGNPIPLGNISHPPISSGFFTLYVTPTAPTALIGITPNPAFLGTLQSFFSGASLPGNTGYGPSPIVNSIWTITQIIGGSFTVTFSSPSTYQYYTLPNAGTYTVTLTVVDSNGLASAPVSALDVINPLPAGCNIDLTSQNWRYVDPTMIPGVPNGAGPGVNTTLFRPGDYVQLFAYTSYNLDEVAGQLVSFEVTDNNGNVVLTGTAITNSSGIAEYDFRIPWPTTNVQSEFGWWTASASWQCGALLGEAPYEKTQVDMMGFQVGWGLWITGPISLNVPTGGAYDKIVNNEVTVKINVENDYRVPVPALATATLFDELSVPIAGPAAVMTIFYPGITAVTFTSLMIPEWAFAGVGTVHADLFTTWPASGGTSFCPEVSTAFTIKAS